MENALVAEAAQKAKRVLDKIPSINIEEQNPVLAEETIPFVAKHMGTRAIESRQAIGILNAVGLHSPATDLLRSLAETWVTLEYLSKNEHTLRSWVKNKLKDLQRSTQDANRFEPHPEPSSRNREARFLQLSEAAIKEASGYNSVLPKPQELFRAAIEEADSPQKSHYKSMYRQLYQDTSVYVHPSIAGEPDPDVVEDRANLLAICTIARAMTMLYEHPAVQENVKEAARLIDQECIALVEYTQAANGPKDQHTSEAEPSTAPPTGRISPQMPRSTKKSKL